MNRRGSRERATDRESLGLTEYQYQRAMAVPWRRAVLRFKPAKMSMGAVYKAMGWAPGMLSTRSRFPDLRISIVAQLADAIHADRGRFAKAVMEELERG